MIEVKVTVDIPGLPEAINSLASAISAGATVSTPAPVKSAEENQSIDFAAAHPYPGTSAQAPAVNPSPAPAAPAPAPMPVAAPAAPVTAATAPAPAVSPSNPIAPVTAPTPAALTIEDLGRAGAGLIDAGKMPQLMGLLGKYGVQAITQLQPGQIGPFAAEMQALGAKI